MPLGPIQTEQIHAPEFEDLVTNLCRRPGMYVNLISYGAVCAFLDGFDAGRSGGPLIGLHPWLVLKAGDGNNLHWSGLTLRMLPVEPASDGKASEERAILALGELLGQFFEHRRQQGLTKIFTDYARWRLR
jgi:hypothetical protein